MCIVLHQMLSQTLVGRSYFTMFQGWIHAHFWQFWNLNSLTNSCFQLFLNPCLNLTVHSLQMCLLVFKMHYLFCFYLWEFATSLATSTRCALDCITSVVKELKDNDIYNKDLNSVVDQLKDSAAIFVEALSAVSDIVVSKASTAHM